MEGRKREGKEGKIWESVNVYVNVKSRVGDESKGGGGSEDGGGSRSEMI